MSQTPTHPRNLCTHSHPHPPTHPHTHAHLEPWTLNLEASHGMRFHDRGIPSLGLMTGVSTIMKALVSGEVALCAKATPTDTSKVLCMTSLVAAVGCWLTERRRSFCVQLVPLLLVLALVVPIVHHTQNHAMFVQHTHSGFSAVVLPVCHHGTEIDVEQSQCDRTFLPQASLYFKHFRNCGPRSDFSVLAFMERSHDTKQPWRCAILL